VFLASCAAVATLWLAAAPAAEPAALEATRWYGGPAVITEASALGLVFVGAYIQNETSAAGTGLGTDLAGVAAAAWLLGAPVNHGAHGHPGKALASFGLRLAAVVVPVALGLALNSAFNHGDNLVCTGDPPPQDCSAVPAAVIVFGALGGIIAVTIVDDARLARDGASPRAQGVSLVPRLHVGRVEASLSLAAIF
jgi:hypothetical protein